MAIIWHSGRLDRMKKEKAISILAVVGIIAACVFSFLVAYQPGLIGLERSNEPSNVKYETSVFDKDKVMDINIVIEESAWKEMLENAMSEEYTPCDIEVNGTKYKNVGIRPKGNTSLSQIVSDDTTDRYSFKVEFDHYVKDQSLDGLDKLALNNLMSDSTYMKEYLSYDILSHLGVNSSLYSYAKISVNGEYWGLYLALECVEESFLKRTTGSASGQLYKPETFGGGKGGDKKGEMPGGMPGEMLGGMPEEMPENMSEDMANRKSDENEAAGSKSDVDKSDETMENKFPMDHAKKQGGMGGEGGLLAYVDDNLESYDAIFESASFKPSNAEKKKVVEALKNISDGNNLSEYMDVDQMLRYIAASAFLLNDDSYFGMMYHNYYLYERNGKLSMIPWDFNLSFGGFGGSPMGGTSSDSLDNATSLINRGIDSVVSNGSYEDRPMFKALLNNETYMEQYHAYLQQMVDEYFNSGLYKQRILAVKKLISSYVKNDPTAFYTYEEFTKGVDTLLKFVELRGKSVEKQLNGEIARVTKEQDKETLVDGSGITVSDMGSQGGGENGMMPFGQKGEMKEDGEDDSSRPQQPNGQGMPTEQGESQGKAPGQGLNAGGNGEMQGMPPAQGEGQNQNQNQAQEQTTDKQPPQWNALPEPPNGGGKIPPSQAKTSSKVYVEMGICFLIITAAVIIVKRTKRRKY